MLGRACRGAGEGLQKMAHKLGVLLLSAGEMGGGGSDLEVTGLEEGTLPGGVGGEVVCLDWDRCGKERRNRGVASL